MPTNNISEQVMAYDLAVHTCPVSSELSPNWKIVPLTLPWHHIFQGKEVWTWKMTRPVRKGIQTPSCYVVIATNRVPCYHHSLQTMLDIDDKEHKWEEQLGP